MPSQLGIISLYNQQVSRLQQAVACIHVSVSMDRLQPKAVGEEARVKQQRSRSQDDEDDFVVDTPHTTEVSAAGIQISTVDAFQVS